MKKNQLITLVVVAGFIGAVTFINKHEPSRVSQEQADASAEVEELIADAEQAGENAKAQAGDKEQPPNTDPIQVELATTAGTIVVKLFPEWAPLGVEQFLKAAEAGVYDEAGFFRVVPGFVVQFGISGNPEIAAEWDERNIPDEPVKSSNARGTLTFAKSSAPNSRTTQMFINLGENTRLDQMGFAVIGKVIKGMEFVDTINAEYREEPDQQMVQTRGNAYLKQYFPNLDYIKKVKVLGTVPKSEATEDDDAPEG